MKVISNKGGWLRKDVPLEHWKDIGDHFDSDETFAVLTSGSDHPVSAHDFDDIIAGLDWLRQENNPQPAEPPLNADHYIVGQQLADGKYPCYGPFKNGCVVPHWLDLNDIDNVDIDEL